MQKYSGPKEIFLNDARNKQDELSKPSEAAG